MINADKQEIVRLEKAMNGTSKLKAGVYTSKNKVVVDGKILGPVFEIRKDEDGNSIAIWHGKILTVVGSRREAMAAIAIRSGVPYVTRSGARMVWGEGEVVEPEAAEPEVEDALLLPPPVAPALIAEMEPAPTLEEMDHEETGDSEHPEFAPLTWAQVARIEDRYWKQEAEPDFSKKAIISDQTECIMLDFVYDARKELGCPVIPTEALRIGRLMIHDIEAAAYKRANLKLEPIEPAPVAATKETAGVVFSIDLESERMLDLVTSGQTHKEKVIEVLEWAASSEGMRVAPKMKGKLKGKLRAKKRAKVSRKLAEGMRARAKAFGGASLYFCRAIHLMHEETNKEGKTPAQGGSRDAMSRLAEHIAENRVALEAACAALRDLKTRQECMESALEEMRRDHEALKG